MKLYVLVGAVALMGLSSVALAQGNNGGGNGGCGVGQQTNGCGTGGAGGAGGNAAQSQIQGQAQGQMQGQGQVQGQSSRNNNRNTANGGAGGLSSSAARGGDQSQTQSVDNSGAGSNSNNYTQAGIPVSSAIAPSFAIGSCQWAFSGGAQFFGFGASAGSAGMYEFCKNLMKAQHFRSDGNRNVEVAKALECQDSSIRAAYKTAGQPCLEDMPRQTAQAPAPQSVQVASQPVLQPGCRIVQPGNYLSCQ